MNPGAGFALLPLLLGLRGRIMQPAALALCIASGASVFIVEIMLNNTILVSARSLPYGP